tara:strand:+ start:647 stop:1222 length:576 start_codon:yes stop_codon:yes gene_type:complete
LLLLIISQNLLKHDVSIPKDTVLRINLAWCDSIEELNTILAKHQENNIFIDLPTKRIKPPNNRYTINDLLPVLKSNHHIKYLAISNVESPDDILSYMEQIPDTINLVPKIESPKAVKNIEKIVNSLKNEKIVMLDHDDLFTSMINNNESADNFKNYIQDLVMYCSSNKITLLRTVGVIFSDNETRISQYVK